MMSDCVSVPTVPSRDAAAKAFLELQDELHALPSERQRRILADIPRAVSVVLGALPRLEPHREAIAALPGYSSDFLDRLRRAALAAYHAHLQSLPRPKDETERKRLLDEAKPLRETLLRDAEALAHRGLLDAERVASIRAGQGHLDLAGDLLSLATLFSEAWLRVQGRTAATVEEIDRAGELGARLLAVLAEDAPVSLTWADLRKRAFSLLHELYEDCRRAVTFLRWHEGDARDLAPTMYIRPKGTSASPDEPDADANDSAVA